MVCISGTQRTFRTTGSVFDDKKKKEEAPGMEVCIPDVFLHNNYSKKAISVSIGHLYKNIEILFL